MVERRHRTNYEYLGSRVCQFDTKAYIRWVGLVPNSVDTSLHPRPVGYGAPTLRHRVARRNSGVRLARMLLTRGVRRPIAPANGGGTYWC